MRPTGIIDQASNQGGPSGGCRVSIKATTKKISGSMNVNHGSTNYNGTADTINYP